VILAHHLGKAFGPQPVGQRARSVVGKIAGFEKIAHSPL